MKASLSLSENCLPRAKTLMPCCVNGCDIAIKHRFHQPLTRHPQSISVSLLLVNKVFRKNALHFYLKKIRNYCTLHALLILCYCQQNILYAQHQTTEIARIASKQTGGVVKFAICNRSLCPHRHLICVRWSKVYLKMIGKQHKSHDIQGVCRSEGAQKTGVLLQYVLCDVSFKLSCWSRPLANIRLIIPFFNFILATV